MVGENKIQGKKMSRKLALCLLLLACILMGPKVETHCGFPTEEEHRLVKKWMGHHGIMDCYQDHNGRYYFIRRGQKINLIDGGDYEERRS